MIFIYDDGIHNNAATHRALAITHPHIPCQFVGAKDIIDGCLQHCKLLIMPGGADLYFCEKLNGTGNKNIRNFVNNGGSYLGICAGAYYGCSSLDWNNGEIDGARELGFYNGRCTGPVFEWLEKPDDIYNGSWITAAPLTTHDGQDFFTQYNGGGVFTEPNNSDTTKVIARYTSLLDSPVAIIGRTHGKGRYILSSPHIEKFGHLLTDGLYEHHNKSYEWEENTACKLLKNEQQQKAFFKAIIENLL